MLRIGTFNTHANGVCEVEERNICSFDANLFGDMVGNMSINSLSIEDFLANIEAIKADFCSFVDNIAGMAIVPDKKEEVEIEGEEETPIV